MGQDYGAIFLSWEFEVAAGLRGEQHTLLAEVKGLLPVRIPVRPQHVVGSLRLLGFDGDLPKSERSSAE